MAKIQLEVVTPERVVLEDEADIVIARGADGDLGVLHGHEPLITPLAVGELTYRNDGQEEHLAVAGGFLEVRPDKVVVLADVAERAEDIDQGRAQEAARRAEEAIAQAQGADEQADAHAALERAQLRLRVAEFRGRQTG